MTVTALTEIESCPRRWALSAADYPALWAGRGYPPRVQLSGLGGTVVHFALEAITKALIRQGCGSVQDSTAVQILKELGGYTKIVHHCIDRVFKRLGRNPRAKPLLETAARSLNAQVPELRTRVQTILCRVRLPNFVPTSVCGGESKQRRPLRQGAYPEIELRAERLGWKGTADLLVLSDDSCEITDFKTGARKDRHRLQMQAYALLWSRDHDLNPGRRLADRLILSYIDGEVEVAAPTAAQLDELELQLVTRRDAALRAVSQRPPEARPSPKHCRSCDVRHLCDLYWLAETQRDLATQESERRFADVELTIKERHGPTSWDAVVEVSRGPAAGARALLRAKTAVPFRAGERLRVLDVDIEAEIDDQQPAIITIGSLSETYTVG